MLKYNYNISDIVINNNIRTITIKLCKLLLVSYLINRVKIITIKTCVVILTLVMKKLAPMIACIIQLLHFVIKNLLHIINQHGCKNHQIAARSLANWHFGSLWSFPSTATTWLLHHGISSHATNRCGCLKTATTRWETSFNLPNGQLASV